MHELAIAEGIMAVVEEHADGRPVTRVDVTVGHLRQVVPDALTFAFQLVSAETIADGAELVLHPVEVRGLCTCGTESRQPTFPHRCPACGSSAIEIVSGEELCVESFEVAEPEEVR